MSTNTSIRSRVIGALATALVATSLVAAATPSGAEAKALPVRGHAVVHVEINNLGYPGFTNGWKWSSVHGTDDAGFEGSRLGVGRYLIRFNGIDDVGGVAHLVPWGRGRTKNPPVCTVAGWAMVSSSTEVTVQCFDALTGRRREGQAFDVSFTNQHGDVTDFEYLWADKAAPAAPYEAVEEYAWSTQSGTTDRPVISQIGTGRYDIHIRHAMGGTWPRVTAFGQRARWCNPMRGFRDQLNGVHIRVACFGPGGVPANSRFTLTVSAHDPLTGQLSTGANLTVATPASLAEVTPTFDNLNTGTFAPSNSHQRDGLGIQMVWMPEVRLLVPSAWVAAWGDTGNRCMAMSYLGSNIDPTQAGVRTRCVRPDGTRADTRQLVSRWDRPTVDLTTV